MKESVSLLNPIIPYTEAPFVPFNPTSQRPHTQETVDSGLEQACVLEVDASSRNIDEIKSSTHCD